MIESIATTFTNLAQAQVQQEVQTAVLAQSLDEVQRQGASLVNLINASGMAGGRQFADPLLGSIVDTFA